MILALLPAGAGAVAVPNAQGMMLLLVGPFIDQAVSQRWLLDYTWTQPALQQLLLSCSLAVLVNVSQYMCLGRFSAVTFQVGSCALQLHCCAFYHGEQQQDSSNQSRIQLVVWGVRALQGKVQLDA